MMYRKSFICIETEKLNINDFPHIIIEYIFEAISLNEKVIIFSDTICDENIQNLIMYYEKKVLDKINVDNIVIENIDTKNFNIDCLIDRIPNDEYSYKIIWDLKNIVNSTNRLEELEQLNEKVFGCCKSNIKRNFIYIYNGKYEIDILKEVCSRFNYLIITNMGRECIFKSNSEKKKALWFLEAYAELKDERRNLVLFNENLVNIPISLDNMEYKQEVINKFLKLCDFDFCIKFIKDKYSDNFILDGYYGLTKKHEYYLLNDKVTMNLMMKYNSIIINSMQDVILNYSKLELNDNRLKDNLKNIEVTSTLSTLVKYGDIKSIMWVGRYKGKKEILKKNMRYVRSMCKTVFYLIQEQERVFYFKKRMIENEKLRAMGEMTAGINHELNNILTPIIGSVQILKEKYSDNEDIMKQLETIEQCTKDGIKITNQAKKISSKCNKKEMEIFNLDNIIEDAVNLTKNRWFTQSILNGIKISVDMNLKSNAQILGNITEIREVLINIITNAIDAMPKGGKIRISSSIRYDCAVIKIKDNGIGMEKSEINRIFEPFYTTKGSKGTGLGLSVSYNIINSHEGNVKVESKKDKGTCFIINLPICKAKKSSKSTTRNFKNIDFDGSILVIDDKISVRNVIAEMIKSVAKCDVKCSDDNNAESEILENNYDIIISDFSMPKIDGLEIAKKVKQKHRNTCFCLMTGWSGDISKDNIKYVDVILNKPISLDSIKDILMNYKNYNLIEK